MTFETSHHPSCDKVEQKHKFQKALRHIQPFALPSNTIQPSPVHSLTIAQSLLLIYRLPSVTSSIATEKCLIILINDVHHSHSEHFDCEKCEFQSRSRDLMEGLTALAGRESPPMRTHIFYRQDKGFNQFCQYPSNSNCGIRSRNTRLMTSEEQLHYNVVFEL